MIQSAQLLTNLPKPQQFVAKLEERIILNDKFMELHFELVTPFELPFWAGQYVSLQVAPTGERRSYSITSRADIAHGFELLVDIEPKGLGTTFLANLAYGSEVRGLGPLGRFVIPPTSDINIDQNKEIVLIGTGSGVAPLYAMVCDQLQVQQTTAPITLFWGMRHANQMFWQDKLMDLSKNFPNFKFHPVISRPMDGWILCSGRVTDCLRVHEIPITADYYLCGNNQMISDVQTLLIERGIVSQNIHYEKFY